jgi:hypothetical protein
LVDAGAHEIGDRRLARFDVGSGVRRGDQLRKLDLSLALAASERMKAALQFAGARIALKLNFQFPRMFDRAF